MKQNRTRKTGLLAFLLALCVAIVPCQHLVFAVEPDETVLQEGEPAQTDPQETEPETEPGETEPEETEPEETEPEETEPKETEPEETEPETEPEETEPEETEPEETEPEETEPEETEPKETEPEEPTGELLLQWQVDSDLIFRLDEDDYSWTVFDRNDNKLPNGSGVPVKAGYVLTGMGNWHGQATVTLTITNQFTQTAQLQLMFMNELSTEALSISQTIKTTDGVRYIDGILYIEPDTVGEVTLTVSQDNLQDKVVMTEDTSFAGWVQVRILSPVNKTDA